jgi:hypothetical protein
VKLIVHHLNEVLYVNIGLKGHIWHACLLVSTTYQDILMKFDIRRLHKNKFYWTIYTVICTLYLFKL